MNRARSYRELRVYQEAMAAAKTVFWRVRSLPHVEAYRLGDQILRSSRAVPALIAEAWARRAYHGAFREKLSQALAETMETEVWIGQMIDCNYVHADDAAPILDAYEHIGAMITLMIQKAESFAPKAPT